MKWWWWSRWGFSKSVGETVNVHRTMADPGRNSGGYVPLQYVSGIWVKTFSTDNAEHNRISKLCNRHEQLPMTSMCLHHGSLIPKTVMLTLRQRCSTWYLYLYSSCTRVQIQSTCTRTCTWRVSTCTCTCTWPLVLVLVLVLAALSSKY